MAKLSIDVHLDAACTGLLCSLDGAHNPAWVAGRWAHSVGVQGLGTHAHLDHVSPLHGPQSPGPLGQGLAQPWESRSRAAHSPGGHGVPFWLKGTVLASHSDPLHVVRSDPQV